MPWISNEDDALKRMLRNIVITDRADATRSVDVFFRNPAEGEVERTYPSLIIDMVDIELASDREHRGLIELNFVPEGLAAAPAGQTRIAEFPIPYSLIYQVSQYTRSASHDRQLTALLLGGRFRRGAGIEVPADQTIRRLDLLDFRSADTVDADGKRLFRKDYTIAISSELFAGQVEAIQQALEVSVKVSVKNDFNVLYVEV